MEFLVLAKKLEGLVLKYGNQSPGSYGRLGLMVDGKRASSIAVIKAMALNPNLELIDGKVCIRQGVESGLGTPVLPEVVQAKPSFSEPVQARPVSPYTLEINPLEEEASTRFIQAVRKRDPNLVGYIGSLHSNGNAVHIRPVMGGTQKLQAKMDMLKALAHVELGLDEVAFMLEEDYPVLTSKEIKDAANNLFRPQAARKQDNVRSRVLSAYGGTIPWAGTWTTGALRLKKLMPDIYWDEMASRTIARRLKERSHESFMASKDEFDDAEWNAMAYETLKNLTVDHIVQILREVIEDENLTCMECGKKFLFVKQEREELERRFGDEYRPPKRCMSCRKDRY
jgi:hypothetical protein